MALLVFSPILRIVAQLYCSSTIPALTKMSELRKAVHMLIKQLEFFLMVKVSSSADS